MLVFSRKNDESVVVGAVDDHEPLVTVTVLEIGHAFVRLGFEATTDAPVYRQEAWQRIYASGQRDSPIISRDGTVSRKRSRKRPCFPDPVRKEAPTPARDRV